MICPIMKKLVTKCPAAMFLTAESSDALSHRIVKLRTQKFSGLFHWYEMFWHFHVLIFYRIAELPNKIRISLTVQAKALCSPFVDPADLLLITPASKLFPKRTYVTKKRYFLQMNATFVETYRNKKDAINESYSIPIFCTNSSNPTLFCTIFKYKSL